MRRLLAVALAGTLVISACSSDSDGADETTTTTTLDAESAAGMLPDSLKAIEDAQSAFCRDAVTYLDELDRLGGIWTDSQITVGDVTSGAEKLAPAKEETQAAGESLGTAVDEYERLAEVALTADDPDPEIQTQLEEFQALRDEVAPLIEDVEAAEDKLTEVSEGIDENTVLTEAAADFTTAAFSVQVSWLRLYQALGCLEDDDQAIQALTDYIAGLQNDLTSAGFYSGPVDGNYGPETVDAVKALQADAGLTETGLMDPATQIALGEKLAELGVEESQQISALQGALKVAGYYGGPIDGEWSDELEAAVRAAQADAGLPETGELDPATLQALLDALSAAFAAGVEAGNTTTTEATTTTTAETTTTVAGG